MPADKPQDATQILIEAHRTVEALFERYENAKGLKQKQAIAHEICTDLKAHCIIEEEIFYPALRGKIDDDTLNEALVEHDGAKRLINEIEAADPSEEYYDSKVKVLSEDIEHHVKEEEKESDNMFYKARRTDVDLIALGAQLKARQEQLMAQAKAEGGLPPARMATS